MSETPSSRSLDVRAGLGVASDLDPEAALGAAIGEAREQLGPEVHPDALLVAVSAGYGITGRAFDRMAEGVSEGEANLIVEVGGVLAGGRERYEEPAVAALAVAGVEAQCSGVDGSHPANLVDLAHALGAAPSSRDPTDLVILAFDGDGSDPRALAAELAPAFRHSNVVGLAARGGRGEAANLFASGTGSARGGVAALRLGLASTVVTSHGCRALGPARRVTRARGHWLEMLDERPALDCLKADAGPALAADLAYARRVVLAEQLASSDQPGREPSRLRNLAGIDLERGSVALPNPVALGDRIAFVARDARAAREDLNQVLDPLAACSRPPFGLYLSCRARGESLFGIADLELAYVERAFAGSPVLGLATPLQLVRALGDDGEAGHLLTHSAVVVFPSTG